MIKCPNCSSVDHVRYRSPKQRGLVVYRRKRCLECSSIFLTAEVVVSGKIARQLAILEDLI